MLKRNLKERKSAASESSTRSRTGCQTCRSRKLKCDEQRPICGQCLKSHRECIRSEGITFRHQQNAALNQVEGQPNSLDSFYKYKNTFTPEQLRNFVPIPTTLDFIQIVDPFADEQRPLSSENEDPSSNRYNQQVAAHSLEALSTAAADHPPYPSHANFADFSMTYGAHPAAGSGYGPARHDMSHAPNYHNANINFILNPSQTPSSVIDPTLDASTVQATEVMNPRQPTSPSSTRHEVRASEPEDGSAAQPEEKMAYLLRNFQDDQA